MATIQERLNRMRQDGQTASVQQRLNQMKRDGQAAQAQAAAPVPGGSGVTPPTARQGAVTPPRANPGGGAALPSAPSASSARRSWTMPDWVASPSLAPHPGVRSTQDVQKEIDGVEKVIQGLRERQDELNGQARLLDHRVSAWGRLGYTDAGEQNSQQSEQLRRQAGELSGQIAQLERDRAGLQEEWERADNLQFDLSMIFDKSYQAAVDKAMSEGYAAGRTSFLPSHRAVHFAMAYLQEEAKEEEGRGDSYKKASARFASDIALEQMEKGQKERLAYYVGIGDYDGAASYLMRIAPKLNRKELEKMEAAASGWAQEHPALGAAANMASWPLNVPAYFENARQSLENLITGETQQSPYFNAYIGPKISGGTAQGTQEAARNAAAQATGSELAGDAAAFLTGTGLSIGQNATQIALLGPGSLPAMAMSAAGGATADALDRGATPGQAFLVGTAGGAIEAITEKIPLENLFRLAKEGGGEGLKATMIELLKQMGTEASEEMISEIANNLVDAAVMGDSSEFQAYVRELQAAGLSKEEAEQQAYLQFYLINVGLAGLGGAISGGVMGGGAMALGHVESMGKNQTVDQTSQAQAQAQAMGENDIASPETKQAAQDAIADIQKAAGGLRQGEGILTSQTAQGTPQGAQSAAMGQNEAAPADRAAPTRGNPNVSESDTGAVSEAWLKGLRDTARQVQEDYARGMIGDAEFDGMMDAIEEQAALKGVELLDIWERLDGGMSGPARKGAEYGTDGQQAAAPEGQQLSDGDGGRISGPGSRGEAGDVGAGGPQGPADGGGGTGYRDDSGQPVRTEAVSSKELGLANGTDARTVRVLPEESWNGTLRTIARKVRRETGLSVRFTLGPMEVLRGDGTVRRVRGVYNREGAGIVVQTDNRSATAEQIADHEIFHSYAQADPGLVQAAEDAVTERYGREELRGILEAYAKKLRGIADISGLDAQAVADLKNEVMADAFAGINAFGAQTATYQEAVYDTLEDRGVAAPRGLENAQATDSRRGPPAERFSLEEFPDGRRFVDLDTDQGLFDGLSDREKTDLAVKIIRERFAGKIIGNDNPAFVNSSSAREYGHPVKNIASEIRDAKMRAAPELDNLMDAGFNHRSGQDGQDGHVHPRATGGFEYYDVIFKVGDDFFQGVINLEVNNRGRRLKDITKIRNVTQDIYGSYGQGPKSVFLRNASTDTIAQSGAAVKGDGLSFPTAEDTMGTRRYSADEDGPASDPAAFESGIMLNKGSEVMDGSMLPTFAETQARRTQETGKQTGEPAGNVSESDTGGQMQRPDAAEALPAKARDYLKRVERRLTDKIGVLLSVPKAAQRKFLQDIVQGISAEYLSTGQVSQETRDQLFEQAYEQGVVADREYYDNYKHVRDYLRSTPITVSEQVKGDITDYGGWRRGAFGTLRLVKSGGIGVDTAYMELQDMAPGLFPDSITHPADQLRHILETAKDIRVSEQSLDEYHGPDAEAFKQMAWRDFDEAVADAVGELRQVKRYADERAQQGQGRQEARAPMTVQETAALYGRMKEARRGYQRAAARNLLTQHDEIQVGRLLRGELELEHLDPAKDNVRGITAVYEAKLEYEEMAGRIREWNQQRKAALRAQADGFLEGANQWKDKLAGILYSRETMERNIRDIVPDRELADQINKTYFQPVHQAAAAANKMKNEYRDRVRALKLSRKAAKGDAVSEAHAVQLLGEAEDNIRWLEDRRGRAGQRDGKTIQEWQAVIAELWEKSPGLDQNKIRGAVEEFRAIYDELFQQMNEARVRNGYEPVSYRQGYFPHFQADSEGLMAQFGRALGIETAVTNLPTTINGLTHTFKPGIQWFGNALERKGFDTAYDAVQGFDRYIEGAADVIHQTDNIQALRALGAQARYRTGDEGLRQQVNKVQANEELTDQEKQALIDEIYKDGRFALSNFVVELDEYTNLLANKKSRADRNMEQALGRRMYNIVKGLESRVAANMVAVNPASWLTNFVPLTQGWGTVKTQFMLEGMWDTLRAVKADDGMVGMSSFLTNRRGSDPIVRTWAQGTSAFLSKPMDFIDSFTADSLVRARFKQNQAAGLSEAASIEEADAWAAGVMADRSKGATPTLFNRSNPLTKLFTQFQLEVNNQLSYLFKDLPSDAGRKGVAALAAALFKLCIGAYLYNEVYEYFIGRRCALDPIGILNDTVGDFTGYQMPNLVGMAADAIQGKKISFEVEKQKPLDAVMGLGKNVAEEIPFVGGVLGGGRLPISSALPDPENLAKAALNSEWSGGKRVAAAAKELGKPLTYTLLPFGGGQIKKIYQGLKAVAEGGSYTVDNKGNDVLQYPVFSETLEDRLLTLPTAMTFGKSSLPTAREWAERNYSSMSAKQTACYQGMTELGVPQRDAYQLLREIGDVEAPTGEDVPATERAAYQKRKLLQEAAISDEGKGVVYYTMFASDKERELMDGLGDKGEGARVLMELKDVGAESKGQELSAAKKNAILSSSLSEEEKDAIFRHVLGKDSKGARYSQAFAAAGLDQRTAAAAANALNGLTSEEGRKTVSDAQKWRAVLNAVKDAKGQKAALLTVMSDSARMRYEIAGSFGIQPEAWVQLKEALPLFDEDGNGSYSGREVTKAIDALGSDGSILAPWDKEPLRLSREEKAALWQLFTGSKSGSGNPYSTRVGRQAAKELERVREETEEKVE